MLQKLSLQIQESAGKLTLPAFLRCEIAFWRLIPGVYQDGKGKSIKPLQQTPIATLQKMPNNYSAPGLILATVQKSNAISEPMAT